MCSFLVLKTTLRNMSLLFVICSVDKTETLFGEGACPWNQWYVRKEIWVYVWSVPKSTLVSLRVDVFLWASQPAQTFHFPINNFSLFKIYIYFKIHLSLSAPHLLLLREREGGCFLKVSLPVYALHGDSSSSGVSLLFSSFIFSSLALLILFISSPN